jgi:hypothetical protein
VKWKRREKLEKEGNSELKFNLGTTMKMTRQINGLTNRLYQNNKEWKVVKNDKCNIREGRRVKLSLSSTWKHH